MDKNSLITYIESSFIKDIISNKEITDISYNGRDIYYVSNLTGRHKNKETISQNEANDFVRQIANIAEKQFSYLSPILDINIGRYRINAVNSSIGRVGDEGAITFSIRIASSELKITNNHKFMDKDVEELLDVLISNHISIVIAGVPGSGKTEFQKYLISRIHEEERIIIIDQTIELTMLTNILPHDITLWQADERNKEANVNNLIKNGLRNNPDWMIISEARGGEMNDVLTSAMTGIPIITTIHSYDAFSAPQRIARMVMQNEKKMDYNDVLRNVNEHFKIYIYLRKYINEKGSIKRYISSIVEVNEGGEKNEIYHDDLKKKKYANISKNLSNILINNKNKLKKTRFMKHE